jgi:chorismate synthase
VAGNSFGKSLIMTTYGASHGEAIGVIVDGYPSNIAVDISYIQSELDRRKPGQSAIVTQRKEGDVVEVLSGIFEGKSDGTPISLMIRNQDAKSKDYAHIADKYRPSHADYTYQIKYGHRDYRGGGRSSARETAARVAAGALAKILLKQIGIEIIAFVTQVGHLKLTNLPQSIHSELIESNPVRCPDILLAAEMEEYIKIIRKEGDTIGGVVSCIIKGTPVGLGEPVFDKLHADLGKAMLSINACKGFEYGSGFDGVEMKGSQHNDPFIKTGNKISTKTNYSGGIQGGISNGEDIYFRVAFKPVATIVKEQDSVDYEGNSVTVEGKGRHDPCVVPRAVPIVESMAAFVLADHFLRNKIFNSL